MQSDALLNSLRGLAATRLTNAAEVEAGGLELERVVAAHIDKFDSGEQLQIIQQLARDDELSHLHALYEVYETNLENSFVDSFFADDLGSIESYRLYDRFVRLIKNEIGLLNLDNLSHVAFIGSGPLPITALLLNQLTGCRVECYEHYLPAAKISERLIRALGKTNEISVLHEPGQIIDAKDYSAVVVALLAKPKQRILARVKASKSEATKLVCRTSDGLRQVFYQATAETDMDGFKLAGKAEAKNDETISSLLLE